MVGRIGVLDLFLPAFVLVTMIGPTRFGMMAAYAAGLAAGSP
ncbi:MAG: hypothetical protein QM773_19610 [Hyphomonadaceae bacterium]